MTQQPGPDDQPEDHPGSLQPRADAEQGEQGIDPAKTTQRGTPRLSREERREINRQNRITHGLAYHRLYQVWWDMWKRASRPGYVKNGIGIYPLWADVKVFVSDIEAAIGPHPGEGWSIDRVDNDYGYFPWNVRWATPAMQANNRGHGWPPTSDNPTCMLIQGEAALAFSCFSSSCPSCPWPKWYEM